MKVEEEKIEQPKQELSNLEQAIKNESGTGFLTTYEESFFRRGWYARESLYEKQNQQTKENESQP